jgi:Flp pilus assembly CpaE family ATPase
MTQPTTLSKMRAGAVLTAATREAMIEAFTFHSPLSRARAVRARPGLYFLNAKGGVGATTTAVNTAAPWSRLTGAWFWWISRRLGTPPCN